MNFILASLGGVVVSEIFENWNFVGLYPYQGGWF